MTERRRVRDAARAVPPPESAPAAAPLLPDPPAGAGPLLHRVDASVAEKLVVDHNMGPTSREQYRRLAAVLHNAQEVTGVKVIMIASAMPGEGKTLTSSNLGLTFSESYQRRVLLVDADLRRPSLDRVFGIMAGSGLSDGLTSVKETRLLVRQVSQRLSILPAGRPMHDPMAGLTSDRMRQLIREARESFDWVIIDTAPLMLLSDAHLLASMVDGAVLVVRANKTPHDLIKRATDAIGRDRILGVVLNSAKVSRQGGYYNYAGYYHREDQAEVTV
jgi:capsular exopolysaccharide synthesis family protein